LLHLCGYDDASDGEVARIRRREDEILSREGLTNTFPLVRPVGAAEGERESVRCLD
jgi:probable rRNA maturation factor